MAVHAESSEPLDPARLAEYLGRLCRERGIVVSTAESCTGGGVASAITGVAGSSDYFETGYVTYANTAKTRLLGFPRPCWPNMVRSVGRWSRPW